MIEPIINPLSPKLRSVVFNASRILLGASLLTCPDGAIEIVHCGVTQRLEKEVADLAKILADRAKAFLVSQSYFQPYDGEAILRAVEFCQETLIKFFYSRKLRVCYLQNGEWGCAYWRATEPVRMLNENHAKDIYAESSMEINYEGFASFDVLVVQRGLFGEFANLIHSYVDKLKKSGVKIVYETDDDMLGIPVESPAVNKVTPEAQFLINYLIRESDAIFVTTERLSQIIGFEEKTFILPNSVDFSLFKEKERTEERENAIHIMWHGNQSHDVDFRPIEKDLVTFIRDKRMHLESKTGKQILFGFMGYIPHAVQGFLERNFVGSGFYYGGHPDKGFVKDEAIKFTLKGSSNVRFYPVVPTHQFHQALINLQPDICFIPLNTSVAFNEGKSMIKYIESTLAGAACVVMDTGPYKAIPDDCAIKVRTSAQFFQGIRELIEKPERRAELLANATEHILKNFDLKKNSHLWFDALMKVSGKETENSVIESAITAFGGDALNEGAFEQQSIIVKDDDTIPSCSASTSSESETKSDSSSINSSGVDIHENSFENFPVQSFDELIKKLPEIETVET